VGCAVIAFPDADVMLYRAMPFPLPRETEKRLERAALRWLLNDRTEWSAAILCDGIDARLGVMSLLSRVPDAVEVRMGALGIEYRLTDAGKARAWKAQ